MKDSDGDGESNGLELGDPCCIWIEGDQPSRKWGLGHPGEGNSKVADKVNDLSSVQCEAQRQVVVASDGACMLYHGNARNCADSPSSMHAQSPLSRLHAWLHSLCRRVLITVALESASVDRKPPTPPPPLPSPPPPPPLPPPPPAKSYRGNF